MLRSPQKRSTENDSNKLLKIKCLTNRLWHIEIYQSDLASAGVLEVFRQQSQKYCLNFGWFCVETGVGLHDPVSSFQIRIFNNSMVLFYLSSTSRATNWEGKENPRKRFCQRLHKISLEQVAQGDCGCPIPGCIQGQAGYVSGQPGLEVGDPAHSRGVETRCFFRSFQPRPFHDSMITNKAFSSVPLVASQQRLSSL